MPAQTLDGVERNEKGQMVRRFQPTKMQQDYISARVEGFNKTKSAQIAGYGHPSQQSAALERNPAIVAAIRTGIQAALETDGVIIGVSTLKEVAEDKTQPGGARVQAADRLLKAAGVLTSGQGGKRSPTDPGNKPISEWTVEELEAGVAKLDAVLNNTVDITPDEPESPEAPEDVPRIEGEG